MDTSGDMWELWGQSVCQWHYYADDVGYFEPGCGLDPITIDMGPSIRYCPGCGKPIDCFDFGGTAKAAESMRMFEDARAAPPQRAEP